MWRVTNGGVTPRESALPRVKTRRHVTPHVMSAEGEKYTSWGCAAGSGVSMSQGSERQQEVEREREREQREIKEWPLHTAQVMRC